MPPTTQILTVPHLNGISASYTTSGPIDPSKPTLVLVNSFTTSVELYRDALNNASLTAKMNLLAIEPLGHGQTRAKTEHWTYWDTAIMNLQVMERLGVERAFALGTSQGGWVVVRMALLGPERILGILPLGSSLSTDSPRELLTDLINNEFAPSPDSTNFSPSDDFATKLVDSGFGPSCPSSTRSFWTSELQKNYSGEEGRKRIRMATINLVERDGLELRAGDVKCPVLWMHGTDDSTFNVKIAKEEIKLFTGSVDVRLEIIQGGQHFLSASNPTEVWKFAEDFATKYAQ